MLSRLQVSYFIPSRRDIFSFIRIGGGAAPFLAWVYGWDIKGIPYLCKDQVQKTKLFI